MKLPAGIYWICDPCYALNEERFDKLTDDWDPDVMEYTEMIDGVERTCISLVTAHGDGCYKGRLHRNTALNVLIGSPDFPVDSGQIAIVSAELATEVDGYDEPIGIKVEVLEEINVYKQGGDLVFGPVYIETGYDDEECEF